MKSHIYIENVSILNRVSIDNIDCCITNDPAVFEILTKQDVEVYNVNKYISKEYVDQSATVAAELCNNWVMAIDGYYQKLLGKKVKIGSSINTYLYNYIATSFYTYIHLDYLKNNNTKVLIHYQEELSCIKEKNLITSELIAKIAKLNIFGSFFNFYMHNNEQVKVNTPYKVITKFDIKYTLYYLLGFLSVPTKIKVLFDKITNRERIKEIRVNSIDKLTGEKHTIVILHTGEQIEYNTRNWRASGSVVVKCNLDSLIVNKISPGTNDNSKLVDELMESIPYNCDKIMGNGAFDLITFLSLEILNHINKYVLPTYNYLDKQVNGDSLTNNMLVVTGGWDMRQSLLSSVLSKYNISTITFQEGTACLHKFYKRLIPVGYIMHGDAFVSRSLHEEKYFKRITNLYDKQFFCYGSLKMQQSRAPFLSRILARRIWNIKRSSPTVLYVPTRFSRNIIRPYKTFNDIEYWLYQKRLILEGFSNVNKDVYIKIYKKGLISSSYTHRSVWTTLDLPNNVMVKESPDLRFMRFAADIIIVDLATSTLSWALTSNNPVIFMHNKTNPLQDQVYQSAKKAIFVIDVEDDLQWISDIQNILNKPLTEIRIQWDLMKSERENFMEEYVVGAKVSNNNLYNWMISQ